MTDNLLSYLPEWLMAILTILPAVHYLLLWRNIGHPAALAKAYSWFITSLAFFLFWIGGADVVAFRFFARLSVGLLAISSSLELLAAMYWRIRLWRH